MEGKIRAILIFEMLGRPADYLKESLDKFIDNVSKEEGIEIKDKKVHDVKKIEESKQELFTTFTETEISFKDLASMFKVIFVYMPSHIEIVEPNELKIKNFELNTLMTELARRLHQYDEIAKRLTLEKAILEKQLKGKQAEKIDESIKKSEKKINRKKTVKKKGK